MAVNKRLVTVVKLALVVALMWYVFREDPLRGPPRWRQAATKQVAEEVVIEIVGRWQAEPVATGARRPTASHENAARRPTAACSM
jgi:hypothetical protein